MFLNQFWSPRETVSGGRDIVALVISSVPWVIFPVLFRDCIYRDIITWTHPQVEVHGHDTQPWTHVFSVQFL